jgi:hypothetical protein
MAKRDSVLMRVDTNFKKFMDDIKIARVKNSLERKTIADREVTRMLLNTDSKLNLWEEMTKKPRKVI